jgi:hypothetical protein
MIISRGIFGIGGENLMVTSSSLIVLWFKGKELAFALGLNLSIARISGTINNSTQNVMYKSSGNKLHLGYFVGFLFTLYTAICAIASFVLDKKADASEESLDKKEKTAVRLPDIKKFKSSYWLLTGGCVFFFLGYYPFMGVASEMLQKRFAISSFNAGFLMVPLLLTIEYSLSGGSTSRSCYRYSIRQTS